MFSMTFPKCEATSEFKAISATVTWTTKSSEKRSITASGTIGRPSDSKTNPKVNIKLDIQRNRKIASDAMVKALDFASQGKFTEAKQVFSEAIKTLESSASSDSEQVKNLVKDLNQTSNDTQNRAEFSKGGYAKVKQKAMMNQQQRSAYSAAPVYSNQMNSVQATSNVAWNAFSKQK